MSKITNGEDVYKIFFHPGEVVEIRAYGLSRNNKAWEGWAGGSGIVSGYFDNAKDFGRAAAELEQAKAPGVYFTLNPVNPDLLARAANRLKAASAKSSSTTDKDIAYIRWIPIDIDPIRPSGISSTNDELKEAIKLRNKIAKWWEKLSGTPGIKAVSGNGAHLLYRLQDWEIKNKDRIDKDERVVWIKGTLKLLNEKFGGGKVDVDTSVFNPSRIWKLYGTTARKGDSIPSRPHRMSYIEAAI